MKKIIVFIIILFSICNICISITLFTQNKTSLNDNFIAYKNLDLDYEKIDFNFDSYKINKGIIQKERSIYTKLKTDFYTINNSNSNLFDTNKIYKKGDTIGDYTFLVNSRIMEIKESNIKCENLDSSSVSFSIDNFDKPFANSNYDFLIKNYYYTYTTKDYIVSYDETLGTFVAKVYIQNDGGLTYGMPLYVSYVENIQLDENKFYVQNEYIYEMNGEHYILKYRNINATDMYKPIKVDVTTYNDDYSIVEGDIQDGNIIVKQK